MSLTAADVAEIMRLVEQSNFDELTLEMDGIKLTLRRGGVADTGVAESAATTANTAVSDSSLPPSATDTSASPGASAASPSPIATAPPPDANTVAAPADLNVHEVASPLLGTFYRAPKPGAPPFVEVGSQVDVDTVVGIIEVMKLMNTVRAGVRGTVTEILLADGALAEYGETLLRLRKAG